MKSAQVGDVIYMTHPEMAHGTRLMILWVWMTKLMLMVILTASNQPIKGWKEVDDLWLLTVFSRLLAAWLLVYRPS